jgi:hypothetical protein
MITFFNLRAHLGFVNFIPASGKFFFAIFKLSNCHRLDLISTVVSSFYMLVGEAFLLRQTLRVGEALPLALRNENRSYACLRIRSCKRAIISELNSGSGSTNSRIAKADSISSGEACPNFFVKDWNAEI